MANRDDILHLQTRILETIAVGEDLAACLHQLCQLVENMVDRAICSVMLLDERDGTLHVAAAPQVGPELVAELNGLVPGDLAGSCGTAVHQAQPVYVHDTRTDPRWEPLRTLAQKYGIHACWSVPIFASSGDVLGSFAISHPICREPSDWHRQVLRTASQLAGIAIDRDRQDEKVRAARHRYHELFESSPDMIAMVDTSTGAILDCNRTLLRELGMTRDELVGQPVTTVYEPAAAAEAARVIQGLSDDREQVCAEDLQLRRRDGTAIEVSLRVTAMRNDGPPTQHRHLTVWRDITKRKRAEQAMRQSQKLESLGVLASGIAHDFNNLLVGIMGNADLALDRAGLDGETREAVTAIAEASQRAADLTRQLLAYAGRGRLSVRELDLNELVREMVGLVSSSVPVPIRLHLEENGAWTKGDPTQIRQVLMNLLTNAGDASDAGSAAIEVRTGARHFAASELAGCVGGDDLPAGHHSFVEVRDRGCGMDAPTIERIFDPFFTTKTSGRGLGLAATLGIVTSHRGGLQVESAPGEGTTFRLLCPAVAQPDAAGEPDAATAAPTEKQLTVLIVDDEPAVLQVLARMLRSAAHEVLTASCGEEAVVTAATRALDAVVLDVTMPGMSGQETFTSLRALRADLPVVFCSGQSPEDCAPFCAAEPGVTFVQKPFGSVRLHAALAELLGAPLASTPT